MIVNYRIGVLYKLTDGENIITVVLTEWVGTFAFGKDEFCKMFAFLKPLKFFDVLKEISRKGDFFKFISLLNVFETVEGKEKVI